MTHLQNILYESSGGAAGYFDTFGRLAAAGMSANTVPRIASCGRRPEVIYRGGVHVPVS